MDRRSLIGTVRYGSNYLLDIGCGSKEMTNEEERKSGLRRFHSPPHGLVLLKMLDLSSSRDSDAC